LKIKRQIQAKYAAGNKMKNGESSKLLIFLWNAEEGAELYNYNYGRHTAGTVHILQKQRIVRHKD
jgi:hypothetical protein